MNLAKMMIPKYNTACLQETSTVRQGLEIMRHRGYTAIPVLDENGLYVGSVTEGDFLRHILRVGSTDVKVHECYRVKDIFRPEFCPALTIDSGEEEVLAAVVNQNYVPIVDDRGCLCGIVTRKAVIQYLSENRAPCPAQTSAAADADL